MEAIELCEQFREELEQYAMSLEIYEASAKHKKKLAKPEKPTANIRFLGRNVFEHILLHVKRIRSAELENTLRFLNQKQCFALLFYLEHLLRNSVEIELASRGIMYIMKTYQVQLKQTQELLPILKSISLHMMHHFKSLRDDIGVNISALKIVQKELNQTTDGNNQQVQGLENFGLDFSRPQGGDAFGL